MEQVPSEPLVAGDEAAVRSLAGAPVPEAEGLSPAEPCLLADSSGTVSWLLPSCLLSRLAGIPGPRARGPAGGQQLGCYRAVIQPGGLRQGWALGPPAARSQPSGARHSCAGSRHRPKLVPLKSWESKFSEAAAKRAEAGSGSTA